MYRQKGVASILSRNFLQIDTTNILFICGGAFSGLESVIERRTSKSSMGFGSEVKVKQKRNASELLELVQPEDLFNTV